MVSSSKFFLRHKKIIGLYRIADIVMGVVANLLYSDLGYSLIKIASYSKFWGLIATVFGGFFGEVLTYKTNLFFTLLTDAILAARSNLLFAILALSEPNTTLLLFIIVADNLSEGLASTAFVAFLSNLTMKRFTITQFALFTFLMLLLSKLISSYSRSMVDRVGNSNFFIITALMGTPVILLIIFLRQHLSIFK